MKKEDKLNMLMELVTQELELMTMLPKRVQKWESNIERVKMLKDIKNDMINSIGVENEES